ncbi:solute carrier family 22 member 21-like isoform X2 [Sipha flava]|nr:solute carrier family 22 member 21-like isoform X2 [Sipha flava]XP_025421181.1 solute carrier family 22 member 21-like isoform X2 [Sipha flava]
MDLDEILGNFGLGSYQLTVCGLMGLVLMYSNISPLSYAITASDLKYRCEIQQCDSNNTSYNPDWLRIAVPFKDPDSYNEPYKCVKYNYNLPPSELGKLNNTCLPKFFDTNSHQKCDKWVFDDTERTIVNDFNIMCDDNKWKLSMVGTINSIGQFIGIPLSGFISDKYGRKFILITGSVSSAILGTIRSFTNDYYSFLFFEFFDSIVSSGVYAATFVLGLELVSPKSRVTVSTLMGCFYPMGAVFMGLAAYMILDWRIILRVLYLPGTLILGYIWYVPESMRWLQTQNRIEEMADVLSKIAKSNGKTLPSNLGPVKDALIVNAQINKMPEDTKLSCSKLMKEIFSSKEIFLRLINCSFCWITITLVYYGLSLTSVEFNGNKYLNFMLVNAVEVPAFLTSWYFMERFSRRNTQAFTFIFSGIGCILVNLIPSHFSLLKLLSFLGSKYAITMAFNTMYVFTAEMFPTELRMSLFGITSMFGRLGSMIAPQMSLLASYFGQYVPILLFGIISFIAGALSFLFPETKDQKLPDTVKQAEFVGEVYKDSSTG